MGSVQIFFLYFRFMIGWIYRYRSMRSTSDCIFAYVYTPKYTCIAIYLSLSSSIIYPALGTKKITSWAQQVNESSFYTTNQLFSAYLPACLLACQSLHPSSYEWVLRTSKACFVVKRLEIAKDSKKASHGICALKS